MGANTDPFCERGASMGVMAPEALARHLDLAASEDRVRLAASAATAAFVLSPYLKRFHEAGWPRAVTHARPPGLRITGQGPPGSTKRKSVGNPISALDRRTKT